MPYSCDPKVDGFSKVSVFPAIDHSLDQHQQTNKLRSQGLLNPITGSQRDDITHRVAQDFMIWNRWLGCDAVKQSGLFRYIQHQARMIRM